MGKLQEVTVPVEVGRCGHCGSAEVTICFDVVNGTPIEKDDDHLVIPLGVARMRVSCPHCGASDPV